MYLKVCECTSGKLPVVMAEILKGLQEIGRVACQTSLTLASALPRLVWVVVLFFCRSTFYYSLFYAWFKSKHTLLRAFWGKAVESHKPGDVDSRFFFGLFSTMSIVLILLLTPMRRI